MAARRGSDPVRELERLVDVGGDDDHNIGELLHRERATLAPILRLHDSDLQQLAALPDGVVRQHLRRTLERLRVGDAQRRKQLVEQAAHSAAAHLACSAVFRRGVHHLDVACLLSSELTGVVVTHVCFAIGDATIPIARTKLIELRRGLPRFPDLRAFVDVQGLHLRWRGDRGRLLFYPQVRLASDTALFVELPEAREVVTIDAPSPPPRARSSRPFAWADVLAAVATHL